MFHSINRPDLKICWLAVNPTGSTRNMRVKQFFWCSFLKKKFFSHKCIILAMLSLESKLNFFFFLLHHFFSYSCYFDFSYPLSSVQVSLGCAKLGCQQTDGRLALQQIETQMANKIFKYELSFKKLKIHFCFTNKNCVILNVHYCLCYTKLCERGGVFD